jgi:hypothetical protein
VPGNCYLVSVTHDETAVNADGLARHVIGVAACEKTHDASHVRVFDTHFLSQDRRHPWRSFFTPSAGTPNAAN